MTARKTPSPEQVAALDQFQRSYGKYWKRELLKKWREGTDDAEPGGCYLRQVRNNLGPTWLQRY